jgi:hypothetical protein
VKAEEAVPMSQGVVGTVGEFCWRGLIAVGASSSAAVSVARAAAGASSAEMRRKKVRMRRRAGAAPAGEADFSGELVAVTKTVDAADAVCIVDTVVGIQASEAPGV